MKKNTLQLIAGLSLLSIVFTSCSTMKQSTAFSDRKYYNYRHHDPVVVLNKPETKRTHNTPAPVAASKNDASTASVQSIQQKQDAPQIIAPSSTINLKSKSTKPAATITSTPAVKNTVSTEAPAKHEEAMTSAPKTEMAPTNTTDGGGSGVNQVVIIILAILIPPLGVYLYENRANTPFWITLILCLASLFVYFLFNLSWLLWLVAIIYAVLVVTGTVH